MKVFHTSTKNKWNKYSTAEQMANIGAEVGRAINWRKKGIKEMSSNALYRALELIDFTIDDPKNRNRLGEILRVREVLCDYFVGQNMYKSTDQARERYFLFYNFKVRLHA